ncbi:MAG: GGDEF domain-containing protein, partial [Gammaproteobacteria bacterium]|nr:GGDEF domain-containing protein [Gammaproteobacteria bacterium]
MVLAGLFHRGRGALAALVLLWAWAGLAAGTGGPPLSDWPAPRLEAVLLLAPLDLLLIACLVETSLLSLRGLLVTVLLGIQTALGLWPPAWCWDAVWQFERLPARSLLGDHLTARGWPTPGLSAGVAVLAGLVAAVRWWRVRDPVLAGIAVAALMAGGIGYGMLVGVTPSLPLLGGGLALLIAVGWASYRLAFLDALTGLPGRRMLDERMVRLGRRWAVAMVDVDHFKKFNDEHGHEVGDQVLRMVAARLRHH